MTNRPPTKKQQQVLEFIRKFSEQQGHSPTLREIADHFKVNVTAVVDHVKALKKKGLLTHGSRQARSLRVISPMDKLRKRIIDIPLFAQLPTKSTTEKEVEAKSCISIDVQTLGIKATAKVFALEVKGDSMSGKNILAGDIVVFEHGLSPKSGDVVAASTDQESSIKSYVTERGKPYLKSENGKSAKQMIPAEKSEIQGVMVALIRKRRA